MDELQEKQKRRLWLLRRAYEESGGDPSKGFNGYAIGEELGWDRKTVQTTGFYLRDEGLLNIVAPAYWVMTHSGVKEYEDALSEPERPTEHFLPQIIQYIIRAEQITSSPIQQGVTRSVQAVKTDIQESDLPSELESLIEQLAIAVETMLPKLTDEEARRVTRALDVLMDEAATETPQRQWWEVSAEGLKKAAKDIGEIGKPVLNLVAQIIPHLAARSS